MDKLALVTGSNKGIGFETSRQLGQGGVTVLMSARDVEKGRRAVTQLRKEGLDVQFIHIDLTNDVDLDKARSFIEERYGRLDILINNAGASFDIDSTLLSTSPTLTSIEIYRKTFESNFFQVIALTKKLLPLLMKSAQGRIVNVSSILASLSLRSDPNSNIHNVRVPAYSISKTALNAFTLHLAYELINTSIKVNAAYPGWVKTDMGGDQAPMDLEMGAKTSVQLALLSEDGPTGGFFHLGSALPW